MQDMQQKNFNMDIVTVRLMAQTIHEPVKSCEILYPDPFP